MPLSEEFVYPSLSVFSPSFLVFTGFENGLYIFLAPKRSTIDLPARLISAAAGGRPKAAAGPGGRVGRGCSVAAQLPGQTLPRERRGTPRWDGGTVRPRLSRDLLPPSSSRQDILDAPSAWNSPDPALGGTSESVEKTESCLYEVLPAGAFSKMFVYATHQLDFQHSIVPKEEYPVL